MAQNFPQDFFKESQPVALVAGGAGFVGSHVCEALLLRGVGVICLDILSTGAEENIKHLKEYPNFFLLEQDVSKKIPEDSQKLDYVLHLAGIEAHLNGEDVSIETLEANSIGSKNLLEVAKNKGARFLLASVINVFFAKRFAEALVSEYGQKKGVNARIVRLGDVYGPRMMLSSGSIIARLIKETLYNQSLVVSQEEFIFPVYIDDVVEGIIKALLSSGTKGAVVSLAGSRTSVFSLAQLIKQTRGNIDIVFRKGESQEKSNDEEMLIAGQAFLRSQALITWQPEVSLEEGIVKTLDWFSRNRDRIPGKTVDPEPFGSQPQRQRSVKRVGKKESHDFWLDIKMGKKSKQIVQRNKKLVFAALFLGLFWFFALPFLKVGSGLLQLNFARNAILAGNSSSAEAWSGRARVWFEWAKDDFSHWENLPLLGKKAFDFQDGSRILIQKAQIGELGARSIDALGVLFGNVQRNTQGAPNISLESLSSDLKTLEEKIAFLEADMEGRGDLPPFVGQKVLSRERDLSTLRKASGVLSVILAQKSDLTGERDKKTYLILFQDNADLRPTGGSIGSYALVTFSAGSLVSFDVQDVSIADSELKGHVEPPLPIKDYLGEANWFLRDSNWSPDFPTSAQRAAWFIDKELGIKVDGVFAIDQEFIKRLFTELDLNQTVEGLTTSVARQALQLVTNLPKEHFANLGRASLAAFEERHLLLWTGNVEVDIALKRAGWTGALLEPLCGPGCIGDYLQFVEANFGNVGSPFIVRSHNLEVSLNERNISHSLTVSYASDSGDSSTGGDYKSYVRLFTSPGSISGKAYLMDPATGFQEELALDVGREGGKEVFGTLLVIPANQSRTINFWWDLPLPVDARELSLLWQKQAGTLNDPVWIKINPPSGGSFEVGPESSLTIDGTIGYNVPLAKDISINAKW